MAKLNTKIVMLKGEQGKDGTTIKSIEKSASSGLVDTYTITLTNGSKFSFNVTNGKWITSIDKTSTGGLVDTYTITYNDGTASTFTVTNGEGIQNLKVGGRNLLGNFNKIINVNSEYDGLNEGTLIDRSSGNPRDGIPQLQKYKGYTYIGTLNEWSQTVGVKQPFIFTIDDTFDSIKFKFGNKKKDAEVKWDISTLEKGEYIFSFTVVKPSDSGTGYGMTAKYIHLEKGNIATDWTPSPEDLTDTSIKNSDIDTILNS